MFTVTPLFPVSIMSHKMETLEELVMMMKLLQELTDPDGRGGAANEPGTCHHNGAAPPGLAARVPISPEHRGKAGGRIVWPLGPLHTIIKHWALLSQEGRGGPKP